MLDFSQIAGFDWDWGNIEKSAGKHGVSHREAEELFLDPRMLVLVDEKHSGTEPRYHAYGKTAGGHTCHRPHPLGLTASAIACRTSKIIAGGPVKRSANRQTSWCGAVG